MEHYHDDKQGRQGKRRVASYLSDSDQSRLSSETDLAVSTGNGSDKADFLSNLNDADADRLESTTDFWKPFDSPSGARQKDAVAEIGDGLGTSLAPDEFEELRGENDLGGRRSSSAEQRHQSDLERLAGVTDFGSIPQRRMRRSRDSQPKRNLDAGDSTDVQQAAVLSRDASTVRTQAPTPEQQARTRVTDLGATRTLETRRTAAPDADGAKKAEQVESTVPKAAEPTNRVRSDESLREVSSQRVTPEVGDAPTHTKRLTSQPNVRFADSADALRATREAGAVTKTNVSRTSGAVMPTTPVSSTRQEPPIVVESQKPVREADLSGSPVAPLGVTSEVSNERDVAPASIAKPSTPPSAFGKRREAMGTSSSAGGREERAEETSQGDIVAIPEMVVSVGSERPKARREDEALRENLKESGKNTRSAPNSTIATPSETTVANSVSERMEPREVTPRRERSSHRAGGHITLGSYLGRLGRTREVSAPEEQAMAQEASPRQPVRAEPRVRPESDLAPEPARESPILDNNTPSYSEPRVGQEPGYVRYEPKSEAESDMTRIIDKSSRPASAVSNPHVRVAATQTPTPDEEALEPEYASDSKPTYEPDHETPQVSAAREPETNDNAPHHDTDGQSRRGQRRSHHARHAKTGAKGNGFGGFFSRSNSSVKASASKSGGGDVKMREPLPAPPMGPNASRKQRMIILVVAMTVVAAAVAGVVFLITNAAPGSSAASVPAQQMVTAVVYRGDFIDDINVEGTVDPLIVMDVNGEVDGIVENLVIGQGSYVTAGDTLFHIKNDALENAVSDAKERLSAAERAVNDTDLAYRQAQADYQNAWNIAAMSNNWATFDQTGLTNAINAAAARRSEAVATRDSQNTALIMAQAALDRCDVHAPISGIVMELNVVDGVSVGAGTPDLAGGTTGPLLKIGDVTQMKVTTLVSENNIPFIHPGQVATVTFPALPGFTQTATVNAVSSTPSGVALDASGTASYAVEFQLAGSDPNLKPGMAASLNVVLQSASDSLIIPSKSIWQEIGGDGMVHYYVNVVTNSGELRKSEVSVIAQNVDEAAVWGEIGEGDIVRVNG